jgi:2-phospho-L-lactate guanylyltransferase (CobY/MobA/RfbA family)
MLISPPEALPPRLGPDSLARHSAEALRRGLALTHLPVAGLALDIDTPADLVALMAGGGRCVTLEVCARLEMGLLLGAGSPL